MRILSAAALEQCDLVQTMFELDLDVGCGAFTVEEVEPAWAAVNAEYEALSKRIEVEDALAAVWDEWEQSELC